MENPVRDVSRIVLPPASYLHEREKIDRRWPAAQRFIAAAEPQRVVRRRRAGFRHRPAGRHVQHRPCARSNCSEYRDAFGNTKVPLYVLNVTYPLVDEEVRRFCSGKRAVLLIEEGQPDFIEQNLHAILRKAAIETRVYGKDLLPMGGEYTAPVILQGIRRFVELYAPRLVAGRGPAPRSTPFPEAEVYPRPPSFCTGCPERPIFTAMKLVERETGAHHISCDIGCHLFSILPPFNLGATTMGYGLGWAGAAAFNTAETGTQSAYRRACGSPGAGRCRDTALDQRHDLR